uniref:oxygenase MpaB family protein n=1 Tax=Sporichthya sp. TaxID=65475 RepID=UPI00183A975E|nr:DUF2236 domain-containing protein [Sporichthya sp.]
MGTLADLRANVGASIFARVAGPEGPARRERILGTPGPRWFAEDRPIRRVHGDAAMFVGGLRALLLQSLHPLAMAGVVGHSGYRGDPWGRLQRTSTFLATTTFGTAQDAQAAVDQVLGIHGRVRGTAPDGRPYSADDPHLLQWVHVAEIDSFLRAHQRFGARALNADEADAYVADAAHIARSLGVPAPPLTVAELSACLDSYRAELAGTAEARAAARYLVFTPPLPVLVRAPYAVLAANAVALL